MNFSKTAVKRPVTTLMLMMIVLILGGVSLTKLPIDLFPKMEFPVAIVMVNYPNAAPEEIESLVTRPLEQQMATVQSLNSISSISSDGSSTVIVQFENGTDMKFASLNMREKIDLISDYLPDGASKPIIITADPSMVPIMGIYISSNIPLTELNARVNDDIIPAIERSEGIASASIFGNVSEEIRVIISQEALVGYGLSIAQISQALAAENISLPSGDVSKGTNKLIVRTIGEFKSSEDIKKVPITLPTREVIHLQDVATIEEGVEEQTSIGRVDRETAIGISITKQSTANTVNAAKNINATIKELNAKYPDLSINVTFDQSEYVNSSISSVVRAAVFGCLLSVLIIFLFLRNLTSTLVIAISIPVSIIVTFTLMYFSGITLNMLSLGGLAIGVGMLVDDSIVVLENIYRTKHEGGLSSADAAVIGAKQVTTPVFAATMTKIAVFLPIVFVEGITAIMFKEFSYTISFALLASLVVSLTVVPMLSSKMLRGEEVQDVIHIKNFSYRLRFLSGFTKVIDFITKEYISLLRYSLTHRKRIITIAVAILLISVVFVGIVGGELLPVSDEGSFSISVETPYGTSLSEKDKIMKELEEYVHNNIAELELSTVTIGSGGMFSGMGGGGDSLRVNLVPRNDRSRSTTEITNETRKALTNFSTAKITVAEESMTSSMGAGSSSPIQIYIRGDDLEKLKTISEDFISIIKVVDGTADVKSNLIDGNPELKVIVDRNTASYYGVTAYQLANALQTGLSGTKATTLKVAGNEKDINISLNTTYKESVENMKQILLQTSKGTVAVSDIASFEYDNSPSRINRQDQVRTVTINSALSGRDLQSVSKDIEAALSKYNLPTGYYFEMAGTQREMVEAFSSLGYALILSIIFVFMILASQFESLIQPFIIMLAIPFALTGAFISLFITGTPLSLPAFMGIIMLVGIVVNNSILLIDFINQNKETYENRTEAIVGAGKFRLRPILMTMLTTNLGLLPIALAIGEGSELEAPMGIAVIGGLLFSTVITLIIVPVFYSIIDDKQIKNKEKREIRKALKEQRKLESLQIATEGTSI